MILPIYPYGEESLGKKSEDVDLDDPALPQIIQDMYDTLRNTLMSIALAAPQIGINKRIFIIEGDEESEGGVFINPKILSVGGYLNDFAEACLSFPCDIRLHIKRPTIVELEWYDEQKTYHKKFITEFVAKVVQHEMDHLDGILITDKTTDDELKKNKVRLDKTLKKKVRFKHPVFNYNNNGNESVRGKSKNGYSSRENNN